MTQNTITDEWQDFARMVFAGMAVSDVQRSETRLAFHAGAFSVLCSLQSLSANADESASEAEVIEFAEKTMDTCARIIEEKINKIKLDNDSGHRCFKDMSQDEINAMMRSIIANVQQQEPADSVGSIVVMLGYNNTTHFAASVQSKTVPECLRELADNIEARDAEQRRDAKEN